MKRIALVMLALSTLTWAEPEKKKDAIVMRVEAVQVSGQVARQWRDGAELKPGALDEDGVRLLQSTEVCGVLETEAATFIGRKNPIIYYDARATQFQVQYVDVGAKLSCKCKAIDSDRIKAQLNTELSLLERNIQSGATSFPSTITFKEYQDLPGFNYGDHIVVGTVQGSEARHYLQLLGAESGLKNDNVYFVLTVEKI